jgi:hypothetical protein
MKQKGLVNLLINLKFCEKTYIKSKWVPYLTKSSILGVI